LGSRELEGSCCSAAVCWSWRAMAAVPDGGAVAGPEHGGEVQGVGAAGEGFLELPVGAEPFEGGGQAAA
jgi:hypothetical protein